MTYTYTAFALDAEGNASSLMSAWAATPALTWTDGGVISPFRGSPTDVSCPTTTFCMAVDASGQALTRSNGVWSSPTLVVPTNPNGVVGFTSVSCPTTTYCLGVLREKRLAEWRAGAWTVVPVDQEFQGVSCWAADACALTPAPRGVVSDPELVRRVGGTFTDPVALSSRNGASSVSCPTSTCFITTYAGSTPTLYVHKVTGTTSTTTKLSTGPGQGVASCTSTTSCMVTSGDTFWTLSGSTWSRSGFVEQSDFTNLVVSDLACTSATSCSAAGYGGTARWNGSTWSIKRDDVPWARALDCASGSNCVVVDERGRFVTWNGSTWSARSTFDNTRGGVRDLDCTSSVDCVATDGFGNVLRWSGGSSWALSVLSDGPSALDCAGTFCLSWDEWTSTWRTRTGATWSGTHPPVNLQAAVVVCASSTRCFAPGDGTVAAFTGSSWKSPAPLPVDLGPYWTTGGDCPTSTFCVLVGSNGRSASWNGSTWASGGSVPVEQGLPVAVDCVTPNFCMATAGQKSATWNGSRWQAADDVGGDTKTVSCTSTTRCFAVAYGRLHAWDGRQWSETTNDFGWTSEPRKLRCLPAGRCILLQGDHAWWTP